MNLGDEEKRSWVGGGPREPGGGTCTFAPLGLKKGGGGGTDANSLARLTQQFNADGTAAGDLERKVITISELATSAEQWLTDPGERALCELCGRKGALEAAERRALKGSSEALRSPDGLSQRRAPGMDRLPCARVSGCTACLGAALHPRLGKRAGLFGQHVGSEKVCLHPPGALGSFGIPPAAEGSVDPEGPRGWRCLAKARGQASATSSSGMLGLRL